MGLTACGGDGGDERTVVVRGADDVQIVPADEAAELLARGQARGTGPGPERTEATVAVAESSRSFQTRLGTALATFNGCLQERGLAFVGLPGQTDDPRAADPDYLPALVACNNESGIASVLQEQGSRQAALDAEQKERLNTEARTVFECLLDRGWDFGDLEPNENGVLTPTAFPDDIATRQDEFGRDLDACGWNDLELG